jgi:hypothetical protein
LHVEAWSSSTAFAVAVFFGNLPLMALMRLSAALMSASVGVMAGIVKYLWRKKTVSQTRVALVVLM